VRANEIANGKYVEIEPKEVKALQLDDTSFDLHDATLPGCTPSTSKSAALTLTCSKKNTRRSRLHGGTYRL
jgi:hypothetical protein